MKTKPCLRLIYLMSFQLLTIACYAIDPPVEDDRKLKEGESEELMLTGKAAPAGYLVLEEADLKSRVIKRVDKAGIVMVKMRKRHGRNIFYVSDWSYLRSLEGKPPTYIYILPKGADELEAADPDAYWQAFYDQMKSDHIMRNCEGAFYFFYRRLVAHDVAALNFLLKKLQSKEPDIQARGSVLALLCESPDFKHDEAFAQRVLDALQEHQDNRPNGKWTDRGEDSEWDFIGYPGGMNRLWVMFLIRNAPSYEALLAKTMLNPKVDLLLQWVSIHGLARHKLLSRYETHFKPAFFRQMFRNLRDDKRRWNAEWATRILVILEPVSRPQVLQRLGEKGVDEQESYILGLIRDGLTSPKNQDRFGSAVGYLDAQFFDEPEGKGFHYELDIFRRNEAF